MRLPLLCLCTAASLFAWQERQTTTYVYDSEGRRIPWSSSSSRPGSREETLRNLNGREVPQEKVQERVLRQEDGLKIVEQVVQRFDAAGQPLPPEKRVVEETTRPDGSAVSRTTVYRGDLNGRLQLAERTTVETRESDGASKRELIVERPNLNGSFEPVEKRIATTKGSAERSETDEVVYRPDGRRGFAEAARTVLRQTKEDGRMIEQTDEYETATTGAMQLSRQTVSRVVRQPDGSERRETDVFGSAAPGRPAGTQLQLRERQLVEKQVRPDGTTVESLVIQRPSLQSTRELGPPVKVSETVCRGDCLPKPAQP